MIRIRVLTSRQQDQDVEAHLALLKTLPRVEVDQSTPPLQDQIALILRQAVRLMAGSETTDVMLTVGEPALVAATLAWRGPIIHLPVGLVSKTERRLLRWRSVKGSLVTVVSTHLAATHAIGSGIATQQVRVIRTIPPELHAKRDEIRDKIGIDRTAPCAWLAGRMRNVGSHRMSLWTSSILAFRDQSWRVLIDPGRFAEYVLRFSRNTSNAGSIVLCDQWSAPELAAASDVVIVDNETLPSYVAIAGAAKCRVPLIVDPATWQREQLQSVPAIFVTENKPRAWARAAIDAVEGKVTIDRDLLHDAMAARHRPESIARQWLEVLQTACGRRKSQVA